MLMYLFTTVPHPHGNSKNYLGIMLILVFMLNIEQRYALPCKVFISMQNYPVGAMFYHDDCIADAAIKNEIGLDLEVAQNQWYHLCLTVDTEGEAYVYLNGLPAVHFTTTCRPDVNGTGTFTVGVSHDEDMQRAEYFEGWVDELKFFNVSLTEDEVKASICDTNSTFTSGLVAHYTFDGLNTTGAWYFCYVVPEAHVHRAILFQQQIILFINKLYSGGHVPVPVLQ